MNRSHDGRRKVHYIQALGFVVLGFYFLAISPRDGGVAKIAAGVVLFVGLVAIIWLWKGSREQ